MAARLYAPACYLWFRLEVFNGYVTLTSFCFQVFVNQISVASEKMLSNGIFFLTKLCFSLRKDVINNHPGVLIPKALLSSLYLLKEAYWREWEARWPHG